MRSLLTICIIVITSLSALAQEGRTVVIDEWTARQIVKDLIELDHARYTITMQDSLLHMYVKRSEVDSVAIFHYKLTVEEYMRAFALEKEKNRVMEQGYTEALKEADKDKAKKFFTGLGIGAALIALISIFTK